MWKKIWQQREKQNSKILKTWEINYDLNQLKLKAEQRSSLFYSQPKLTDGFTTYLVLRIDVSSCTVAPSHSLCRKYSNVTPPSQTHFKLISQIHDSFTSSETLGHGTSGNPPSPVPLLVSSGDPQWGPVQTCSLKAPFPTGADIWWLLNQVRSAQAGGAHPAGMLSCWMWFLFPGPVFCGSIDISDPPHPPHLVFSLKGYRSRICCRSSNESAAEKRNRNRWLEATVWKDFDLLHVQQS